MLQAFFYIFFRHVKPGVGDRILIIENYIISTGSGDPDSNKQQDCKSCRMGENH